jgi:c(7)-type cytochrome triheme protein
MMTKASRLALLLMLLTAGAQAANETIKPIGAVNLAEQRDPQPAAPADPESASASAADETASDAPSSPAAKTPNRTISSATSGANRFNRLMRPPSKRNPPPAKDGIHDPENDGTHLLQHPKEAFAPLPRSSSGNRVDWVKAVEKGTLDPRFDLHDTGKQPIILDLNIVREVKGSMPDVVYPHKQHTEWLDCSNCHPAIFIPKKGANDISMAAILLGQKCGVCHGKVAFPVSECRKCHSKNKPTKLGKK